MALPKENVKKAIDVLERVAGQKLDRLQIINRRLTDEDRAVTGKIVLYDEKHDGGWENVCLNIKYMTAEQKKLWNQSKGEVKGNSNFCDAGDNGLTMIGYF